MAGEKSGRKEKGGGISGKIRRKKREGIRGGIPNPLETPIFRSLVNWRD